MTAQKSFTPIAVWAMRYVLPEGLRYAMTSHHDNNVPPAPPPPKSTEDNWYAKLHPIGIRAQTTTPRPLLNLSIFFRIWLAVALVLVLCGIVIFTQMFGFVRPTAQQVIEDTLFDTSKVMAANFQRPLQTGRLFDAAYQQQLDSAFIGTTDKDAKRRPLAEGSSSQEPFYRQKTHSSFRIYVTDRDGMVVYDSWPPPKNAEGEDYSRWNDVYLTLQGKYGARSTAEGYADPDSSVMYVAQPITDDSGALIGVVSVGKPIASVRPYLDHTRQRMLTTVLLISIVALVLAGLVAWWLKQSISLVTRYTSALAEDTKKPYFYLGQELNSLTDTIETMKHRLENRAYVTDYVHTLTHELKSPLTAIRASSELLEDDSLDSDDRQMLSQTVTEQSIKMQHLIDRLLLLAKVEQPSFKLVRQSVPLLPLLQTLVKDNTAKIQQQHITPIALYLDDAPYMHAADMTPNIAKKTTVYADPFWLLQALQNVLDNAMYFAAMQVTIRVYTAARTVTISIFNDGAPLPDYALAKAFDRYFSLSHQHQAQDNDETKQKTHTPKKGTGLGLTLVKQVLEHHGGSVVIDNISADTQINPSTNPSIDTNVNTSAGVCVSITLPLMQKMTH